MATDEPAGRTAPDAETVATVPAGDPSSLVRSAAWWSRSWRIPVAAGVLLAGVAFICGLSVGRLQSPSAIAATTVERDDAAAVRSFARVTAYVNWDQPSLLGVAKYGNDVTAWTGRVEGGALDCAAFDDGFEVAVQCVRTASNPWPHSFTWTKASDPDRGEYSVRVGRSGQVDGWFVTTDAAPR